MKAIIILYKLKSGVSRVDFERWIKEHDYPAMRALSSVTQFTAYRTEKLLMGGGSPSQQYVEIFNLSDFNTFVGQDMPGETVQAIMGQFMGFAEAPEFIVAESI